MSAITDRQRQFFRLLLRSPDVGDGWRTVSQVVWPLVTGFDRPELIETEALDEGGRVRLTERGRIVVDYLLPAPPPPPQPPERRRRDG